MSCADEVFGKGNVRLRPVVVTVHAGRLGPAFRAGHGHVPRPGPRDDHVAAARDVLEDQRRQP